MKTFPNIKLDHSNAKQRKHQERLGDRANIKAIPLKKGVKLKLDFNKPRCMPRIKRQHRQSKRRIFNRRNSQDERRRIDFMEVDAQLHKDCFDIVKMYMQNCEGCPNLIPTPAHRLKTFCSSLCRWGEKN